jgi:hypothetical protein
MKHDGQGVLEVTRRRWTDPLSSSAIGREFTQHYM